MSFVLAVAGACMLIGPAPASTQDAQPGDTMRIVPVEIPSAGAVLRGDVFIAAGAGPHPTVVQLEGFPGSRSTDLALYLQGQGFNVVAVYVRGQQASDGMYTIPGMPEDAGAIVAFLRTDSARRALKIEASRVMLLGLSAGSLGALRATGADPALRCVAAIVPFNWALAGLAARQDTALVQRYRSTIVALTSGPSPPLRADTGFVGNLIRDAELHDLRVAAASLTERDVLLVGAANDETASIGAHFRPVVEAARSAGATVTDSIVTDTHNLPVARQEVFGLIADWLRRGCRL